MANKNRIRITYPSSEKIYIPGKIHKINVGMRKIKILDTVTRDENGELVHKKNNPVIVYDTSGPYSDPKIPVNTQNGIPRIRESWYAGRKDLIRLEELTSDYGRQRLADSSLDHIRFPKHHLPYRAKAGKNILFEAQLGALRDIDFGIYPYTSSSNTVSAYAPIGAGIPGHKLSLSIGIMKAYSSCVGEGPFTTELAMTEAEKDVLREHGHEYGAATGRPRRVGPFDAVASRYGVQCQGCDELALTLLDVLDYMEEVPIVTAYKLTDGSTTTRFPMGKTLDDAQPVVETVPGWHCDITGVRRFEDLPQAAQNYVTRLEELVGCKIKYISVGPERDACIVRA